MNRNDNDIDKRVTVLEIKNSELVRSIQHLTEKVTCLSGKFTNALYAIIGLLLTISGTLIYTFIIPH